MQGPSYQYLRFHRPHLLKMLRALTLLLLGGCMPRSWLQALTNAASSRSSSLERHPSQPTSGWEERAITAPFARCRHTTAGTRRMARNLTKKRTLLTNLNLVFESYAMPFYAGVWIENLNRLIRELRNILNKIH